MSTKILMLTLVLPLALAGCGESDTAAAKSAQPAAASGEAVANGETKHAEKEGEHAEEGHHEEEGGVVKLNAEQIKGAGIQVAAAAPGRIHERLPLYGAVAPNAERVREVSARFPGSIRSVSKRVGDQVKQGETLATVESDESLQTYTLVAPLSGVVTMRNANPGEHTGDKSLFTIADLSTVWVEVSLFPRDVGKVKVGQSVRVKSADTGYSADGKVVYVAPFGTAANQTLTARVLLDNADGRWAPGLYVTADVTLSETSVPLAIRSTAIQDLEGREVVFALHDESFEPRPVRLGRRDGEMSEVLDGLKLGEQYASANSFILKADLGKGSAEHED